MCCKNDNCTQPSGIPPPPSAATSSSPPHNLTRSYLLSLPSVVPMVMSSTSPSQPVSTMESSLVLVLHPPPPPPAPHPFPCSCIPRIQVVLPLEVPTSCQPRLHFSGPVPCQPWRRLIVSCLSRIRCLITLPCQPGPPIVCLPCP
jgi:hypothetical protein